MKPLVIVSSETGNTRIVAHAVRDALPGAELASAKCVPEDLSGFDPVIVGFWCDRGMAPEDVKALMPKVSGKRLGFFATIGGNPEAERAKEWFARTVEQLAGAGGGNTVEAAFMCRGRISRKVYDMMVKMTGGRASPRLEESFRTSFTHPDREDLARAADIFARAFG